MPKTIKNGNSISKRNSRKNTRFEILNDKFKNEEIINKYVDQIEKQHISIQLSKKEMEFYNKSANKRIYDPMYYGQDNLYTTFIARLELMFNLSSCVSTEEEYKVGLLKFKHLAKATYDGMFNRFQKLVIDLKKKYKENSDIPLSIQLEGEECYFLSQSQDKFDRLRSALEEDLNITFRGMEEKKGLHLLFSINQL